MRILSALFLLCITIGCSSLKKSFKNFNGSYYTIYSVAKDLSPRKDLGVLYGTMHDAHSKEFLILASVKAVSDTTIETKTDDNGNYKLILPEGTYNILFSYVGYNSCITHDIKVFKYNNQRIDVFMDPVNLE